MTDNEIIKTLEWWITVVSNVGSVTIVKDDMLAIYDLIKSQKAENERLEKRLDLVQGAKCVYSYDGETLEYCVHSPCPICKTVDQIRAEAITEFAERLKVRVEYIPWCECKPVQNAIDELAKEMKGESEWGMQKLQQPQGDNDVKCKDCEYLMFSDCYGECRKAYKGIVNPNDSCGKGKKRVKGEQ